MIRHELCQGTMLVMMCETPLAERLTAVLDELDVVEYTRFSGVSGIGATGRHEGTAVWPGTNAIMLTCVTDEQMVDRIVERNQEVIAEHYKKRPGYRVFQLPGEALA